jgi:hypothetical protein
MTFNFFKKSERSIPWNERTTKAGSADIHIDPLAKKKIFGYASLITEEISGLAYLRNVNGVPTISDPVLLKQVCSAARTELDQATVADFLEGLMMDESKVADMDLLRVWWHSHGRIPVGWSGTDEATIEMLVAGNPWLLSLVVNTKGDYKCRVDFTHPVRNTIDNIKLIETPVEQDEEFLETLKAEIKEKVSFGGMFGGIENIGDNIYRPGAAELEHGSSGFVLEDHKVAQTTLGFAAEQVALSEILRAQPDSFREKLEEKLKGVNDTTMCSVPIPNPVKLGPETIRLPAEHVRSVIEREAFLVGKNMHDEKYGPVMDLPGDPPEAGALYELTNQDDSILYKILEGPLAAELTVRAGEKDAAMAYFGELIDEEVEAEIRETLMDIATSPDHENGTEAIMVRIEILNGRSAQFSLDTWIEAIEETTPEGEPS